ncbi:MFS transporter [Pseudomonadales bacterium]|nr:MFS transporter [Pseudomonadales bacterium]MDB4150490.1 MFS transporter [Pseudomonadales bacterium]MDB9867143.1 MFS transporter [Pseudomonadales bacterium]MDC0174803.1 MFS transporter [Pseudomonadales bacterium]
MTGLLISVTALLASVAILLLGHGLQLTLVPLYAVSLDWAPELIGYTGSSYFIGFVVGCLTIPRLVARVGHIRVFAVLIAAATAALLFIGLVDQFWFWMLSRAVSGWAFAGVYMVIESWLNEKTAVEHRGSVLSVYIIITLVSICIGQLLVGFELGFPGLFMLAAALLVLGVVPIGLTSSSLPGPIPVVQFRLARVVAASQVAMVGAFFGGLVTGGFWALGPVVASVNGLEKEQIGMFMAVTILGGTVFQYPVGRLSDRVDRRYVIAGLALLGMLTCLSATVLLSYSPGLIYATMFLFGGMTFPLYSLCLAHANDNTSLSLMEIASGVLMMNSAGSVFGPLIVAFLIGYTHQALFIVSAVALALLVCWTLYRIQFHEVTRDHFEPFVAVRNTSVEIVELISEDSDQARQDTGVDE